MKRLWSFLIVSVVFEIVALSARVSATVQWIVDIIIVLVVLYLIWLAFRGLRRQASIQFPDITHGRVVRKRHWRLF